MDTSSEKMIVIRLSVEEAAAIVAFLLSPQSHTAPGVDVAAELHDLLVAALEEATQ